MNTNQTPTRPLRIALIANAAFSLTSAGLILFLPSLVGDWLGVHAPLVLRGIAAGLVVFAIDLLHQATRYRMATWRALYASAGDFAWVAATVVLLTLFPRGLSVEGNAIVVGVAFVVGAFGSWQLWAAGRAHQPQADAQYRHCIIVSVNAPAAAMWQVIERIGDIQRYMPSLKSSELLGGKAPGVGAVRRCEDRSGKRWAEECIGFQAGESFTVRFLSEAPNFPFPAKRMTGGWKVTPAASGAEVMVWWELDPKPRFLAPILLPILAFQADRDFPKIVQSMAQDAVGHRDDSVALRDSKIVSQLLPRFC